MDKFKIFQLPRVTGESTTVTEVVEVYTQKILSCKSCIFDINDACARPSEIPGCTFNSTFWNVQQISELKTGDVFFTLNKDSKVSDCKCMVIQKTIPNFNAIILEGDLAGHLVSIPEGAKVTKPF